MKFIFLSLCICFQNSVQKPQIYYQEIGFIDAPLIFPDTVVKTLSNIKYIYIIFNINGSAVLSVFNNSGLISKRVYVGNDSIIEGLIPWVDPLTGDTGSILKKYYEPTKKNDTPKFFKQKVKD